jgi:hypothetical protein
MNADPSIGWVGITLQHKTLFACSKHVFVLTKKMFGFIFLYIFCLFPY